MRISISSGGNPLVPPLFSPTRLIVQWICTFPIYDGHSRLLLITLLRIDESNGGRLLYSYLSLLGSKAYCNKLVYSPTLVGTPLLPTAYLPLALAET